MHSFLYIYMPLASTKQMEIMYNIRHTLVSQTPVLANIATALAALFLVISMVRTASRLMSDEQSAGLGGITLGQFIRPICMVVMLGIYNPIIGMVDDITNTVTMTIMENGRDIMDDELERKLSEANSVIEAYAEKNNHDYNFFLMMNSKGNYSFGSINSPIADSATIAKNMKKLQKSELWKDDITGYDVAGMTEKLKAIQEEHIKVKSVLSDKSWTALVKESTGLKGFTPTFCSWLFTFFYGVINAFAEIFLCILAIYGPFTLAFSVAESWKTAPLTWLGKYIELSFWKVIAALVSWIIANSRNAISLLISDNVVTVINEIQTQGDMKTPYVGGGAGWAAAIFSIAGLLCLFSISSITNAVLGMGGGEAMGNASGSANTIAKGVKDAPGKIAGGLLEGRKAGLF